MLDFIIWWDKHEELKVRALENYAAANITCSLGSMEQSGGIQQANELVDPPLADSPLQLPTAVGVLHWPVVGSPGSQLFHLFHHAQMICLKTACNFSHKIHWHLHTLRSQMLAGCLPSSTLTMSSQAGPQGKGWVLLDFDFGGGGEDVLVCLCVCACGSQM